MDVLSPLDAAFLRLEGHDAPMHIASAAVFEGPAPSYDELLAHVATRLPRLPRYRQRVREVPLWLGRPVWVDDVSFDLAFHVRNTALPRPGTLEQLRTLCARVLSLPLDRARPLWEVWLVEGLADGRWALLTKVHHCMVDGIAGFDLLTRTLDTSPEGSVAPIDAWVPQRPPGRLRLLSTAVTTMPRPTAAAANAWRAVRHPRRAAGELLEDAHGLATWARVLLPATASSLSGPITTHRSWAWAEVPLDDVRAVKRAHGGTVNDVVLTLITAAFRELLLARDEDPGPHVVRSLVPVSVRARHHDAEPADANRVSAVVAELPVHVPDAVGRLAAVRRELDRLKTSGEVEAGEAVTTAAGVVPPLLLSTGLFGGFRVPHRSLVTVTTNVPGPRVPLWALGRRMVEVYPFVPIADRLRTGVAITSYDGKLTFGVTGDAASMPDLELLAKGIEAAAADLLSAAPGG